MKIQSLSLLAAAVLACAACKNNAETSAATTDASTSAPASEQAPTAEAPAAGSATTVEATTATAPATDTATAAAPAASGSWRYEGSDGAKRTASVSGHGSDGSAQLVFADDPVWGRTAYVEFAQDSIDCPTGCKAQISVDGGAAKTVQASRPETPQPVGQSKSPLSSARCASWPQIGSSRNTSRTKCAPLSSRYTRIMLVSVAVTRVPPSTGVLS